MGNHSSRPPPSNRISSLDSIETLSGSIASPSSTVGSNRSTSEPNRLQITASTVSFRSSTTSKSISLLERYKEDLAQRKEYSLSLLKQLGKIVNTQNNYQRNETNRRNSKTEPASALPSSDPDHDIDQVRTILTDCLLQYERTHLAYNQQKRFVKSFSSRSRTAATIVPETALVTAATASSEKSFHELTMDYFLTIGKEGGIVYTLQMALQYLSNIVMVRLCLLIFIRLLSLDECFLNRKLFIVFSGNRKLDLILQTYTFNADIVEKVTHLKYLSFRYEFRNFPSRTWLPYCLSGKFFPPFIISWYIYITVPRYVTMIEKDAKDTMRIAMWENTETEKVGLPVPLPAESVETIAKETVHTVSSNSVTLPSDSTVQPDSSLGTSTTTTNTTSTPPIPVYMFAKIQEHLAILQQKQRQAQKMYRVDSRLRIRVIQAYDPLTLDTAPSAPIPSVTLPSSPSHGTDEQKDIEPLPESKDEVSLSITPRPVNPRLRRIRYIPHQRKSLPSTTRTTGTTGQRLPRRNSASGLPVSMVRRPSHYLAYKSSSLEETVPIPSMVPYYNYQRDKRRLSHTHSNSSVSEYDLSSSTTQDWIIPYKVNKVRLYTDNPTANDNKDKVNRKKQMAYDGGFQQTHRRFSWTTEPNDTSNIIPSKIQN